LHLSADRRAATAAVRRNWSPPNSKLQQLGAKFVFIVDSVFNSTPGHVTEICEAILRRKVKISWGCFLRPRGLTAELMKLMARAGLTHIEFGTDSFCDEVLEAYAKHFTFADVLESSELAAQRKLITAIS
jgi:radical SAM superfamily enzyme YgiQ (UPF0313 family)